MIKYLLLRDNKESGPYTFDELKARGLKAYDLVWVENKSAAWRYPCEVEELSSFAPAVEEQPFDRFYKRPAQENNSPVIATTVPLKQNGSSAFSGEPSAVPGKRIIYVTLPAGKNTPAKEPAPIAAYQPADDYPRGPGQPSALSGFLTGTTVFDPITRTQRRFSELARRRALMETTVCPTTTP